MRRTSSILAIAGTVALIAPGSASAVGPGLEANAVDNGNCTVTFSMDNRTNSTFYTMDYWIDGEPLTGQDFGTGPTGRRPPLTSGVAEGTPVWTQGSGIPFRADIEPPFRTEALVDLKTVENLPNPDAATHVVHYRVVLGPENQHHVPEKTVTVTGCAAQPGTGSAGSSMFPHDIFGSS